MWWEKKKKRNKYLEAQKQPEIFTSNRVKFLRP